MKRLCVFLMSIMLCFFFYSADVLAVGSEPWYWPIPSSTTLNQQYTSGHVGVDIGAAIGAAIYAPTDGTIYKKYTGCNRYGGLGTPCNSAGAGCNPNHGFGKSSPCVGYCNNGYGNGICMRTSDGYYIQFAHMQSVNNSLSEGQSVARGTLLGYVGGSGYATGKHCHYQVGTSEFSGTINPMSISYVYSLDVYLDINGYLNGASSGSLSDYGTCDVYINGSLDANDVNDYYKKWPSGTKYEIKDIRPTAEHTYSGNSSYSGTIGSSQVNVNLSFYTYGTLTVKGRLDNTVSSNLSSYGSFDLYINGNMVGNDLTSYSKKWPKDTKYEIRDPKASEGYNYEGIAAGSQSGTLGTGVSTVTLDYTTKGVPGGDWTYADRLPGNITSDSCDIEYKHTYEKRSATSPGDGWTKVAGTEVTTYENSGSVRETYIPQTESNTLVLVDTYYYHYCNPSNGRVNYEYISGYTEYHGPNPIEAFDVVKEISDEDNSAVRVYKLAWKAGYPYTGEATCAGGTSAWWYRKYCYQPRVAVTTYQWRKVTDWQTTKDSAASSVQYRYKLKDSANPVISSVKLTEITPDSYTIVCKASDDTGITKQIATSWTDTEKEANAKVTSAVPETADKQVEISIKIPVTDHENERDVNYHTKISVCDKAGKTVEYTTGEIKVYIPTLVRSARKFELPADLTEIEEEAFAGSIAFGEVVVPDGTETIGSKAFADCSRLVLIEIPDSVTVIADDMLEESSNAVILCSMESEAAAYARNNEIPYITKLSDE